MDGREMQRCFRNYGLRQHQIAGCVGLSGPVLSSIFTGKVEARPDTEKRLIRLLKLCKQVESVIKRRLGGKQ